MRVVSFDKPDATGDELAAAFAAAAAPRLARLASIPDDVAESIARDAAEQVARQFAGCRVYFRTGGAVDLAERDASIRRQAASCTPAALAKRYGLTPQRVGQILRRGREAGAPAGRRKARKT